ncbi:MAG: Ger(x)C family spore germination protein [Syntrophomonas sp.]
MKRIKILFLAFSICIHGVFSTGCWNYREVDDVSIVAGVAIDQGVNKKYQVTVEIVQTSGGRESKTTSKLLTMEGNSILDAVRNGISLSGKDFYWSHAKVIIVSRKIAGEGMVKVTDWLSRDPETRLDVHLLISKEDSAKKILEGKSMTVEVKSFELDDILKNQKNLFKAPQIEIWEFTNNLAEEGISAITPSTNLEKENGADVLQIMGSAVFKRDKLIGFIDGEETKDMLFVQNQIKGGLLTVNENGGKTPVTLEIFKNETKIEPIISGSNIEMSISTDTIVAIDEIGGNEDYIDDEGRKKLEQDTEKMLKNRIERFVKKIQSEYGADIFGFGVKLREDHNKVWNEVSEHWEERFKDINITVKTKVHIRNSAMLSKPLEVSD